MAQTTSAYVFPFVPFTHLDRTQPVAELRPVQTVERGYFAPILDAVAPRLSVPAGGTPEERLLALFASREVVLGDPDWILSRGDDWKRQMRFFLGRDEPMPFTILGFPFKAPVPLKTKRILADFGELAMLKRLHELGRAVASVHKPGARIHVFAEGAFARINGMPQEDSDAYFASLERMLADYGLGDHVVLHETNRIANETEGFNVLWDEVAAEIAARRDAGDATTVVALRDSFPVTFHLNANPGVEDDLIRRAYNNDPSASELRARLERRSEDGVVRYRAFLEARDRIQLLERFAPKGLAMTVSPRPGRLGVQPLPPPANILPYHGLPIWNPQSRELVIQYRWDMLTTPSVVQPLAVSGDADPEPFLYIRPA